MRKLDTAGKAQANTGESEERDGTQIAPCEIQSGQNELVICENKNSLASRDDRLDSLLQTQL